MWIKKREKINNKIVNIKTNVKRKIYNNQTKEKTNEKQKPNSNSSASLSPNFPLSNTKRPNPKDLLPLFSTTLIPNETLADDLSRSSNSWKAYETSIEKEALSISWFCLWPRVIALPSFMAGDLFSPLHAALVFFGELQFPLSKPFTLTRNRHEVEDRREDWGKSKTLEAESWFGFRNLFQCGKTMGFASTKTSWITRKTSCPQGKIYTHVSGSIHVSIMIAIPTSCLE